MHSWILAAAAPANPAAAGGAMSWILMIGMVVVFYVILILPQRKQQKQRNQMLNNLKKGDKVITVGGVHGEIIEFDDEDVKLRVAEKVELKFTRSSIAKVKS